MGLPLFLFGANFYIQFMPLAFEGAVEDSEFAPAAFEFLRTVYETGYLMQAITIAHVGCGALLLLNRFVPLALAVHLPVSIQMVLFHVFLDLPTGVIAYAICVLNLFLIFVYRDSYAALFKPVVDPFENATEENRLDG